MAVDLTEGSIAGVGLLVLKPQINAVAREFGVYRVHLVTHSKGGLWSRAAIEDMFPSTTAGIFSLLTLSTPHDGTAGADLATLIADGIAGSVSPALNDLLSLYFYSGSIYDLTPDALAQFNAFHRHNENLKVFAEGGSLVAANTIKYRAVGADADVNNNGVIDNVESGVVGNAVVDNLTYRFLGDVRRINMRASPLGGWIVDSVDQSPLFQLNDIAVTSASAYFSSRPGLFQAGALRKANHGTVKALNVARDVLVMINLSEEKSLEQSIVQ